MCITYSWVTSEYEKTTSSTSRSRIRSLELVFGVDLDAVRVPRRRPARPGSVRSSMNGICVAVKATTSDARVVAIDDVEVVEVAPGGAHDQDAVVP